jgi:Tol biopolymer transport system component
MDGTQLSYTSGDQRNVMVINADGSGAKSVTTGVRIGTYRYPDFFADGSIILISDERGEKPWTDVWRLNSGGKLEQVFTRIDHGGPFAWAPDGRAVAFHSPRSGTFHIYTVELPGDGIGQFARLRTGLAPIGVAASQPTITTIALAGAVLAIVLVAGGGVGAWWTWRRARRG